VAEKSPLNTSADLNSSIQNKKNNLVKSGSMDDVKSPTNTLQNDLNSATPDANSTVYVVSKDPITLQPLCDEDAAAPTNHQVENFIGVIARARANGQRIQPLNTLIPQIAYSSIQLLLKSSGRKSLTEATLDESLMNLRTLFNVKNQTNNDPESATGEFHVTELYVLRGRSIRLLKILLNNTRNPSLNKKPSNKCNGKNVQSKVDNQSGLNKPLV
jgi:hypothetical protein